MSNEIHNPPVDYTDLSLRVQEQIRRKFLPLCTEDEKQQVQTTLMPMVQFAPSTVSTPSRHVLVTAKIPDQYVQLKNRDTVLGGYEIDLGHCEVVTNSLPADLASCETALDSYETGQDDGEARLRNRETDLDNLEADLDSKEAPPTKQESDAVDCMATSGIRASQPDSATPPAQTAPRFDDKYIEEYRKCYNRAILDIMYLRSLGDTGRRMVQDEQFRDALMEEIKKTTGSLTDATDSAWKIFGYLARS
ncbi:hypothetical protein MY4038_000481 [Beauveria bassiana]